MMLLREMNVQLNMAHNDHVGLNRGWASNFYSCLKKLQLNLITRFANVHNK